MFKLCSSKAVIFLCLQTYVYTFLTIPVTKVTVERGYLNKSIISSTVLSYNPSFTLVSKFLYIFGTPLATSQS